ncbi:unnamed protein product [Darwinula stevensoni]|uniref:Chitinase domain-containing protein 1 n=1 Tax=Darwinula stevensoni TaxID=69355 RepID=A0A7R8XAA0_9CRUS|nr:unnamed protein product [Darwinula stevensoni]CAG0883539.1 unnamed protein product [Darwinula stevensoni]
MTDGIKSSDGGGTKASTVREVIPKEKDLLEFTPDLITKHFPRNVLGYVTPKLKMDGLVLEIWRQTPAQLHPLLVSFLSRFGQTARQNNFEFILVIPPPSVHEDNEDSMLGYFTPQNFQSLLSDVTAFSFMTYDFSSVAKPGPNSPLPWVQGCIKLLLSGIPEGDQVMMHEASSKILVGLNFYGMDYTATGGRPILGRELQNHISDAENQLEDVQVHFSDEAVEHFFSFREKGQQHLVFFPTVHSIQARLQLATSFGVGIAIWELGQGMNFFYEIGLLRRSADMEALYHQTNHMVDETQASFVHLEKAVGDRALQVESEIQARIDKITSNCERLEVLVHKEVPTRRQNAKLRLDQLKYDCQHLQAALRNLQHKRYARERELMEREELLTRRFTPNDQSDTSVLIDYALQQHTSLQNTNRGLDELIGSGTSILSNLRDQRTSLKGVQKKVLDVANMLGMSNTVLRLIEQRTYRDKFILWGGMLFVCLFMFLVVYYIL